MTMTPQHSMPRTLLLRDLAEHRAHVLRTIDGLSESHLDRVVARSGWTPRTMVSHLLHDDEIFWLRAVLGADESAIAQLQDGWTAPALSGPELRAEYRRQAALGDEVLARTDLDAPPRWWPPLEVFDAPRFGTGWEVLMRMIDETAVHAGHLDMAREALDGRQDLVLE